MAPSPKDFCPQVASLKSFTEVEDFINQFETVASLPNWATLNPNPRPRVFFVRPNGVVLTFYQCRTTDRNAVRREWSASSIAIANLMLVLTPS